MNSNNINNENLPAAIAKKSKKKGSKEEVFNGDAIETSGGLRKDDLVLNKRGKIVSKKKSEYGKEHAYPNLHKHKEILQSNLPSSSNDNLPQSEPQPIANIAEENEEEQENISPLSAISSFGQEEKISEPIPQAIAATPEKPKRKPRTIKPH